MVATWWSKTEVLNLPLLPAETWSFNRDSLRDSTRRNSRHSKTSDATEELAQLNWGCLEGAIFVSIGGGFQRGFVFIKCVFYLQKRVFLGNDPKNLTPKKFSGWKLFPPPTNYLQVVCHRSSLRRSCLAAILRQRCVLRGKDVTWLGIPHNFKWGGNELGNIFFFWGWGPESSAVFWISVVVKSDHFSFWSSNSWMGGVGTWHISDATAMKHENSLPSCQGLPKPKSKKNGWLEVSSSSFQSEIIGIPGDHSGPIPFAAGPREFWFHQAKLYDDDAETDLASEYSRPVFKIPEWNTNRGTWSF